MKVERYDVQKEERTENPKVDDFLAEVVEVCEQYVRECLGVAK